MSQSRMSALSTSRHTLEAHSSIGPPGAFRHTSDLRVGVIEVRTGRVGGAGR